MPKANAVTITGDDAIVKALDKLPARVRRKVVSQSLRKASKALATQARAIYPKDTGEAKRAIAVRVAPSKVRANVKLIVVFKTTKVTENARNKFFYPAVIEYGSPAANRAPVAPMRRTYDAHGRAVAATATREIADGIDRETAAIAAKGP